MNYYQSNITKKIMTESFLKAIDYVYGEGRMHDLIEDGTISLILHPTVEECIYYGSYNVAVLRYKEVYEVSWDEASAAVKKLRRKMQRAGRVNKCEVDEETCKAVEEVEDEEE